MSDLKTKPTDASVEDFLNAVEHPVKKVDSFTLLELMKEITGEKPVMWGSSIIGFGELHYKYASGREGDWFKVGFSPRKRSLTVYIMSGFEEYEEQLANLGKHRTGVGCLYINKLADVDMEVLKEIIQKSLTQNSE